jgi:glycosyltransferase involved in cell wall biosynthesis
MRRLRLLWVTPDLPCRGVSAARAYWWALLGRLATRHDVSLLAFVDPAEAPGDAALPPGLAAVERVARTPWPPDDPLALLPRTVAGGYVNPAFRRAIAARLAAGRFDLVQYEFTEMANLWPSTPPLPTILTVHQVAFAQEGPLWRAEGRRLGRGAILLHRYLRELDFELAAVGRAHHVITVSPEDAARLRRFLPDLRVSVSPVGVDCAYFRPQAVPPAPAVDLLFVGHFGHPPNGDAVRFLLGDVLPRVGRPASVRIVGRDVPADIARAARPGIEIAGPVADQRPHLAAAAAVVAPVRFGTGMRGKVLEALAMGRPVVTTSVGAEGLGAVPGRHLLVADGAAALARAIRQVLDDPTLAAALGGAGRQLVESRFDWDGVADTHDQIYERVLAEPLPLLPPAPGRSAGFGDAARRLGRWPAIAAGAALLAGRGLAWHLRRLRRARPARLGAEPVRAGASC